ncbi:MAG TPA: hypothetical protein VIH45_04705, partial [Desulfuromonadaceae bacterium]
TILEWGYFNLFLPLLPFQQSKGHRRPQENKKPFRIEAKGLLFLASPIVSLSARKRTGQSPFSFYTFVNWPHEWPHDK